MSAKASDIPDTIKRSPRERLLEAANELFYAEGIQSVGIDRVIERAGVAKASLYSTFGSKEELVCAYLGSRHDRTLGRLRAAANEAQDPREKILAVFDSQARWMRRQDFHGCAFNAASAEAPAGGKVEQAANAFREDLLKLFTELAQGAGARDPERLGRQLQLIYDGAAVAARADHDGSIIEPERAAVAALIDAEVA